MESQTQTYIYVLQCKNKKFYVGRTTRSRERIIEHLNGEGAAWTKKYKPISVIETFVSTTKFDEDICTLKYMDKYGIESTRGGVYSQVVLSPDQISEINRHLRSANNVCFRCGRSNHFIKDCYARMDINGNKLNDVKDEGSNSDSGWNIITLSNVANTIEIIDQARKCEIM